MRRAPLLLAVVGIAVLTVVLREATISRHRPMPAGTTSEVVVRVTSNEAHRDRATMAVALLATCELEVAAEPQGPPERLGADTFALRFRPALDETDRRQLAGCLEDALLDHVQAKVVRSHHRADAP